MTIEGIIKKRDEFCKNIAETTRKSLTVGSAISLDLFASLFNFFAKGNYGEDLCIKKYNEAFKAETKIDLAEYDGGKSAKAIKEVLSDSVKKKAFLGICVGGCLGGLFTFIAGGSLGLIAIIATVSAIIMSGTIAFYDYANNKAYENVLNLVEIEAKEKGEEYNNKRKAVVAPETSTSKAPLYKAINSANAQALGAENGIV